MNIPSSGYKCVFTGCHENHSYGFLLFTLRSGLSIKYRIILGAYPSIGNISLEKNSGTVVALCTSNILLLRQHLRSSRLQQFTCTAWEVSVFGIIMVHIFPHLDWMRSRITSNTDTFYSVVTVILFFQVAAFIELFKPPK